MLWAIGATKRSCGLNWMTLSGLSIRSLRQTNWFQRSNSTRRSGYLNALESDSKLYAGLHELASMRVTRLMWAMRSQALALAIVFSQSFAIRRHIPSHAKVRSTTHLRGMTLNPCAVSERLTNCSVQRPIFSNAPLSFGPAQPPSAKIWRSSG